MRQQQVSQQAGQSIEEFASDPDHEFFEDVREDMADIIDLATKRGQTIDMQTAYDKAVLMNPETADIISKRNLAKQVQAAAKPVEQARRAAVSVTGAPTVGGDKTGDSLRDSIIAAANSLP